jgi:hypothetical protein
MAVEVQPYAAILGLGSWTSSRKVILPYLAKKIADWRSLPLGEDRGVVALILYTFVQCKKTVLLQHGFNGYRRPHYLDQFDGAGQRLSRLQSH